MKSCKMERSEAIVTLRVPVQPFFYLLLASFSNLSQATLILRFSTPTEASYTWMRADHTAVGLVLLDTALKDEVN